MTYRAFGVVLLGFVAFGCANSADRVIVAAGTTLVDSGLIDELAGAYESTNPGIDLSIIGQPTTLALEMGRRGAADLLLTHAPDLENEFIEEGYSSRSVPVLSSRFVLIGPAELSTVVGGLEAADSFAMVAKEGLRFVSRGDGSGTHETELRLWSEIDVDPSVEPWYLETGQGMGPTIQVADQRDAVTLAEYGAFLAARDSVGLVDLMIRPTGLTNPYTGHVVAGGSNPGGARAFLDWLTSTAGREAILDANVKLFGEIVYQPVTG